MVNGAGEMTLDTTLLSISSALFDVKRKFDAVGKMFLGEDVPDVMLDRAHADTKLLRDLLVAQAPRDRPGNARLCFRQIFVNELGFGDCRFCPADNAGDFGVRPFDAPQDSGDDDEQFVRLERLGDVSVNAGAKALDAVRAGVFCGEKNDRDDRRALVFAESARELVAVHARHTDVADDEIRQALSDERQGLRAASRRRHVVSFPAQVNGDCAQQFRLIVND